MALSPSEAAAAYVRRGWQPVPIPGRLKGPRGNEWQFRRFAEKDIDSFDAIFPPTNNLGLLLGVDSGNLVDVDLDCAEAIEAARTYLPPTAMKHGRPLKPLSHYWYRVDAPKDTKRFATAERECLVEIRSSEGRKGFQTVVPPSVHQTTGELIEWVSPGPDGLPGEPAFIAYEALEQRVRLVAAAALLARVFPTKGARHEFSLALAGLLLRYGTPPDAAYNFVYTVAHIGGSTDPATRAAAVWTTARAIEEGRQSTGFHRLVEIVGEPVARKVCDWLELNLVSTDWLKPLVESVTSTSTSSSTTATSTPTSTSSPSSPRNLFLGHSSSLTSIAELKGLPSADLGDDDAELGWQDRIKRKKDGTAIACATNIDEILRYCSVTKGCFHYDVVANQIVVTGAFANTNPDTLPTVIANWLGAEFDLHVRENDVARQILALALENSFDPIHDYLESLKWDGVARLSANGGWLAVYASAHAPTELGSDKYVEFVSRKWLVSMVARGYEPGCKADLVLILEGLQGKRKSSFYEALAGPTFSNPKWYCEISGSLGDKEAKMLTSGYWVGELPELSAFKRTADQNIVKSFISLRYDKFRMPYGRTVREYPRRIVFVGTTNDDTYLSDVTGNRRYLPLMCSQVDLAAFLRDRDQLFAEAVVLYKQHLEKCEDKLSCCCWWLTPEEEEIQSYQTTYREIESTDEGVIQSWWCAIAPHKRPKTITMLDIAREAFAIDSNDKIPTGMAERIGRTMKKLGFTKKFGHLDGHVRRHWYYMPTEKLLELPQSSVGQIRDRKLHIVK